MAFPTFTMRQLLEAGVHFGHQTKRWNPAMEPFIFGSRNGIHILDLTQTVPMLHKALQAIRDITAGGGRVLVVGTKRQAQETVATAASRCGQYYVNHRWLGGMLTNWKTISNSIKRLRELESKLDGTTSGFTKKELLNLNRERDRLERALGGIKDMGGLPDIVVVIDTNKESIAVQEANKLNIPVVGFLDSNSDPRQIQFPVPANDDASRAIALYCDLIVQAVLDGIQAEMSASGVDVGETDELVEMEAVEVAVEAPAEETAETPADEAPAETPADEAPAEAAAEAPVEANAEAPAEAAAEEATEEQKAAS